MRDQTMESMSRLYPVMWFQRHRWASNIVEFVADLFLWLGQLMSWISAWFINQCVSILLKWWFKVYHITARADDFGFCVAKGVKLRWKGLPDIDVEKLVLKIEWDIWNFRIPSLTFHVQKLRSELLSNLKDAKADTYFSFILKWTIVGPHVHPQYRMLPALNNIEGFHSEVKVLTCLKATDVEIATELFQCKTMSVMSVALCKLESIDFVVIKSGHGTTLQIKLLDLSYLCDGFDPSYYQARQSQVAGVPCIHIAVAWPRKGPSTVCVNCDGVRVILSPKNINNVLEALSRLLDTDAKAKESTEQKNVEESENHKGLKHHTQIVVRAHCISVVLKDGTNYDRGQVNIMFDFSSNEWQHKTTYNGCIGVEAFFHASGQASGEPCAILGNEMISKPWSCSFTGSDVRGQCTIISVKSEDFLSLVLRPSFVQAISNIHQDFQLSLDQRQMQTMLMSLKTRANKLNTRKQVTVELNGVNVILELDVYEQILGLSLDKLKAEFEQDVDQLDFELTLKDIEIEDSIHGITAFQFLRESERSLLQMVTFSVVKDLKTVSDNVSFKNLKATLGDVSVSLEEPFLLKLLQFCDVKHRDQLWGKEDKPNVSDDGNRDQALATSANASFYFEKVEVSSFLSITTVTPAKELPEDLQKLKETLEIPQGMPPTVEGMRVEFASFLRTGIRYRSMDALVRDVRIHYIKDIGRQSGKVLGSLHIFGNVSALKEDIAAGLAELQETGDYVGFVGHIRSGLTDSYYKFADSWSAAIKKTPNKSSGGEWEDGGSRDTSMERRESLVQSIAGNLASGIGSWIFRSSPEATRRDKPQAASTPIRRYSSVTPARSPGHVKRRLIADTGDQESSESEESSFSCPVSVEEWDSGISVRKGKGQEFLRRLRLNLGDSTPSETFECCLKLRHMKPEEKLNVLITSHRVYLLKGKMPAVHNVVLTVELSRLYQTRYKAEGGMHYLELLMRMSGVRRLSLPSPNPADSPLVLCDTAELAQKAARKINEVKKSYEKANCT